MLDGLWSVIKERDDEAKIVPLFEQPRYACPFYGLYMFDQLFLDQKGNQCALMDMGRVCIMEHYEQTPDWRLCRTFNNNRNKDSVAQMLDLGRACPDEFNPMNKSHWNGIPFKLWFDYIMSPERKRP